MVDEGGCAIWFDEPACLAEVEKRLGGKPIPQVRSHAKPEGEREELILAPVGQQHAATRYSGRSYVWPEKGPARCTRHSPSLAAAYTTGETAGPAGGYGAEHILEYAQQVFVVILHDGDVRGVQSSSLSFPS